MKLRVAYIPEHFLPPLFFAEQNGYYAEHGLEIEFVQVLEGTGTLIKLLNDNQVDIALGLTEGSVADFGNGNDTRSEARRGWQPCISRWSPSH